MTKAGDLIKRLDDTESDFLTSLQNERSKEEQEKKRVEGEQIDEFKKYLSTGFLFLRCCVHREMLSVERKVQWWQSDRAHYSRPHPLLLWIDALAQILKEANVYCWREGVILKEGM